MPRRIAENLSGTCSGVNNLMDGEKELRMELILPVSFFQDMRAKIRASEVEVSGVKVDVMDGPNDSFLMLLSETIIQNQPVMIEYENISFLYMAHAHFGLPENPGERIEALVYKKFV